MEDNTDILLRIEQILGAILRGTVASQLQAIRADQTLHRIYKMTGQDLGIKAIAKRAKVSTGKVSGIWKSWEEAGLIVKEGKSYKKLI